jgi:DHA1 family multidrug resistance protein-like MFS transporter
MERENPVDHGLEVAERDASPSRFGPNQSEPLPIASRLSTASSTGSSSTSSSTSRQNANDRMSRIGTGVSRTRSKVEMDRIETTRSQHTLTVGRGATTRLEKGPLPEFGGGKPYPPELPAQEEYVVEFDGEDDPLHGQNWPMKKKVLTSLMLAYTTLVSAWGSSIFSVATALVAEEFHVSSEVGLLGTAFYVLGFATGPICWAPLSELRGRRLPLVLSTFGTAVFTVGVAAGKDLQTVLICRFFAGFFAAAPLAVVAAVFSDIFDNKSRGLALTVFSMTVFAGPLVAPIAGGFIILNKNMGWRWVEWITAIMSFISFILNLFFLEETYPPAILVKKASVLRRRTLNWGIHAKQEEIEVDFRELISKNFSRPLRLLATEPIVLLISIYMSFVYGLLYLFLTAYPLVFERVHGFNSGVGALPYLGLVLGYFIAGGAIMLWQPSYNRKLAANNNIPLPEWRLPPVIVGAWAFAIGLFWFGWSGYRKDIPWIAPTLSGLFTGFGLLTIFLQLLNYLVDAYLML